jgi:membrane protein implicated in regulation of membrane protease activity
MGSGAERAGSLLGMLIVAALLLVALHVVPAPWSVTLVVGAVAFEVVEKGFWVRYTRRIPLAAGADAMIGRPVTVVAACRPLGRVRFGAESWSARCREGAGVGESLVIDAVENVTLVVGRPSA